MIAEKCTEQFYIIHHDWDNFEKQVQDLYKKGFLLTSIARNSIGNAAVMSKISGWGNESRSYQWASKFKTGQANLNDNNPITSLFFKGDMLYTYMHAVRAINAQRLIVFDLNIISEESITNANSIDYALTDAAVWKDKIYLVFSKGLKWQQTIEGMTLDGTSGPQNILKKEGMIITEFIPINNSAVNVIYSSGTGFSEQLLILNPTEKRISYMYNNGYQVSMVRCTDDGFYVFFVK